MPLYTCLPVGREVKKANLTKCIEGLKGKIMSFNFTIDQRLMLVELVEKWIDDCKAYGVKSVTLKFKFLRFCLT